MGYISLNDIILHVLALGWFE